MSRCTAPVRGHHSAAAEAACPACRGRGRYSRSSYGSSYSSPSYSSSWSGGGGRSSGGGSSGTARPRWSRAGSSLSYTPAQVLTLTPFRETVEKRTVEQPDLRDAFLCHAWDDRQGAAKELYDLLIRQGVSVWFSEVDIGLGKPFLRAIDRGLATSRIGIVMVTPAFISRIKGDGSIAELELSTLLRRNVLIPVIHDTTYEALGAASPLLASRNGLNTAEEPMPIVVAKIAELVVVSAAA
jgi:hypothetical protein